MRGGRRKWRIKTSIDDLKIEYMRGGAESIECWKYLVSDACRKSYTNDYFQIHDIAHVSTVTLPSKQTGKISIPSA